MHFGELRTINGISRDIDVSALHLSFLYAPAQKFMRYFQEDTQKDGEPKAWHARLLDDNPARKHELYDPTTTKDDDSAYKHRRPYNIDRTTFDRAVDDYLHPYYDPVFSELPPGERFVIHDGTRKDNAINNVWKRAKNGNLHCPTLPSHDLLHRVEIHGNTSAEKHYEIRIYDALSWIQFYIASWTGRTATGFSYSVKGVRERRQERVGRASELIMYRRPVKKVRPRNICSSACLDESVFCIQIVRKHCTNIEPQQFNFVGPKIVVRQHV